MSEPLVVAGSEIFVYGPGDTMGTETCVGGVKDPTSGLCSEGTIRKLVRGAVLHMAFSDVAGAGEAANLLAGTVRITMNCNLNSMPMVGQCWGSFDIPVPSQGGKWEGTWSSDMDLVTLVKSMHGIARGVGGQLDGLQLSYDAINTGGPVGGKFVATMRRPQ